MKLQEFTELLTKPLMIKMETTDIGGAIVTHRQKTYIWVDTGLLDVFEHSNLAYRTSIIPSERPYPWRKPNLIFR